MPAASRPFFDADEMPAGIVVDEHARPETVEGAVLGVAVDWSALVGGEPELNPALMPRRIGREKVSHQLDQE
jgi:hypothetical protein